MMKMKWANEITEAPALLAEYDAIFVRRSRMDNIFILVANEDVQKIFQQQATCCLVGLYEGYPLLRSRAWDLFDRMARL